MSPDGAFNTDANICGHTSTLTEANREVLLTPQMPTQRAAMVPPTRKASHEECGILHSFHAYDPIKITKPYNVGSCHGKRYQVTRLTFPPCLETKLWVHDKHDTLEPKIECSI